MASSPGDDLTDLDRLADAVAPSFRRKPSMPPPPASAKTSSLVPDARLLEVVIPPAPAVPRIDMPPDFGAREMKRESVPPASPASLDAPRRDRNDATPLHIPQVILIPSSASTPPSPHDGSHDAANAASAASAANAATVRPPNTPAKKKQARSVPEPSVKAEASLHRPSPRVQPKDVGPKIVFNDPQAPSRQPTVAMARVTLQQAQSSVATLRPPPKSKTPFVPLILAACAVIGVAAFVLKSREAARDAQETQEEPKPSAAAVTPAPAPVVDEVDRHVPPPPPEEEDVPHEEPAPPPAPAPPPTPVDRAPDRSPAANSPLRTSPPMAAPALVAAPPATLPPSRAPEAPGAHVPAPTVTAPHPPAPTPPAVKEAASAAAPLAPAPPPAPPKAPAAAKAANSAPAPAIVRDNPF